jgi:Rps23 Pro-64 3,4-dihydroxylase Tpa1-like proline 4-hydroxylase
MKQSPRIIKKNKRWRWAVGKERIEAKDIERARQEAKERMSKSIDAYYDQFAEAKKDRLPSIDEIEAMWGEKKSELNQILAEVTDGLAGSRGQAVKKTAQDATWE